MDETAKPPEIKAPEGKAPRPPRVVLPAVAASLVVVAAAFAVAYVTHPRWLPRLASPAPPAPDPRIVALEARVKAIEERPAPITPLAVVPSPAPAAAPQAVDQSVLDDLARRLGESETRAADLARKVQTLEAAEAKAARVDPVAPALALAVGQLRDASLAGRPFARELDSVRELAKGRRELGEVAERLALFAAQGAPPAAALKARFDDVARAVMVAARAPESGAWTERALARLAGLVAIRRTDERAREGTPDAAVRAAERALAAGDVAAAVAALEALAGPPRTAAERWLADARARAAVDAAVAELHRRALAALAGGG
jgi:hypothetical protein